MEQDESATEVDALIIELDPAGRITRWNAACAALTRLPESEVIGRLSSVVPESPEQTAGLRSAIEQILRGERSGPIESWWTTPAGARRIVWSCSAVRAPDGALTRIVATGIDVTGLQGSDTRDERAWELFDQAPDGIFVVDRGGRCAQVNQAGCRLFGRSRTELVGESIVALVRPEDVARLRLFGEQLLDKAVHIGEWCLRHADGTYVEVEVTGKRLADGCWQGFVRDIRDRKAQAAERERRVQDAETELRWLRAVVETVPLAVLLFERDGRLVFNRRAEELLGMELSPAGGPAQYASRILFADGSAVAPDQLVSSRVLRDGEPIIGEEFLIARPDGTRIPILGSAAPIRDELGTIIGGIGVFQDMSDRMRAEEIIRANERLLNGVFEILPVGVFIADPTGRIVRTNEAGIRIWGGVPYVPATELGECRAWRADTGQPIAPEDWALARALTRGETSLGELIRIQCFDGTEKTIINSAMPLHDEAGRFAGAIVVNEDVTALRETEDALRRAVRSRDEMCGVIAHDLRAPLNVIVMQVQLLRAARVGADAALVKALDLVARAAARMNHMIQNLLEVGRIDAGELTIERERVSPAALLEETADAFRATAASSLRELRVESEQELPAVWGDRERLARVMDNLVGNALKFTAPGGRITLRASRAQNAVVFSVADDGPGIPEEELAHVFDRFWQGRESDRRGAGLGLTIVKGIVDAHGGRVWVESRVGEGSTFHFSVPAVVDVQSAVDAPNKAPRASCRGAVMHEHSTPRPRR